LASILIVDDSLIMRRNLRTILERNGHEVIAEATNGEDAIHLFDLHQPDLVTMDITMPILNGIEAVKQIMTAHAEASIIVISAFDQRNIEDGIIEYSLDACHDCSQPNDYDHYR
jgi:two-component system chemotaxis response regulator CheY